MTAGAVCGSVYPTSNANRAEVIITTTSQFSTIGYKFLYWLTIKKDNIERGACRMFIEVVGDTLISMPVTL